MQDELHCILFCVFRLVFMVFVLTSPISLKELFVFVSCMVRLNKFYLQDFLLKFISCFLIKFVIYKGFFLNLKLSQIYLINLVLRMIIFILFFIYIILK